MSTGVKSSSRVHKGSHPAHRSMVVLAETMRLNTLPTLLSRTPQRILTLKDKRKQSDKDAPIVLVNDLSKNYGSEVEVELQHDLQGKPTMGTRELTGREEERTNSFDKVKIDRTSHAVKEGDCYDTQERGYRIKDFSKSSLAKYYHKLEDQRTLVHLAGARGHDSKKWIVPTDDDDEFTEIMTNPVTAPTPNRHILMGDRDNLADMREGDDLGYGKIREIKERLEEMENPLEPIDLSPTDDPQSYNPMYLMLLTPRSWTQLRYNTDATVWTQMQHDAAIRGKGKDALAVFRGDCFMFENILFRKMPYPIRFMAGRPMQQAFITPSGKVEERETMIDKDAKFHIERNLLLGAQALAMAFGNSAACVKQGKNNFSFETEKRDFGRKSATAIYWANGMKKLRFTDANGCLADRGVMAIDTVVDKKKGDEYAS